MIDYDLGLLITSLFVLVFGYGYLMHRNKWKAYPKHGNRIAWALMVYVIVSLLLPSLLAYLISVLVMYTIVDLYRTIKRDKEEK